MKLAELEGKKILIVGMGSEGKATLKFLKKHLQDAQIETVDEKSGPNYLDKQENYDLAIKSPGVALSALNIPFTTSTNIFFANFRGYTIGITGTKGKSTTTKLTYDILKAAHKPALLAGNIGVPMLEALEKNNVEETIAVCELSSYQLEGFNYSPNIAAITNIYNAHLPHHQGRDNYVAAKASILGKATPETIYLYNPDFRELVELAQQTPAQTIAISKKPLAQPTQLAGDFNAANIVMAQTIATILEVPKSIIVAAINGFEPLPHRQQLLGTFRSIKFYDDATSTTPESTVAALETLQPVDTLLLGGQDTGYDFSSLAATLLKTNVHNLVLFPDSGTKIKKLLADEQFNILETTSMEEAVKFAYEHTRPGGICLLSTATPSFTVWSSYLEKADLFKKFAEKFGKE